MSKSDLEEFLDLLQEYLEETSRQYPDLLPEKHQGLVEPLRGYTKFVSETEIGRVRGAYEFFSRGQETEEINREFKPLNPVLKYFLEQLKAQRLSRGEI